MKRTLIVTVTTLCCVVVIAMLLATQHRTDVGASSLSSACEPQYPADGNGQRSPLSRSQLFADGEFPPPPPPWPSLRFLARPTESAPALWLVTDGEFPPPPPWPNPQSPASLVARDRSLV